MNLKAITDKDLIVYLVASGMEIKNIEKENGKNRSVVYFEKGNQLDKMVINFVNKTGCVNIADFIAAERRIKTLLCMQKISN